MYRFGLLSNGRKDISRFCPAMDDTSRNDEDNTVGS